MTEDNIQQSWTSEWKYEWIVHDVVRCAVCGASDDLKYMKIHFEPPRIPRYVCYGCILEFYKAYEKKPK